MDSTNQMNEMVNTYAQAQQRLWENWVGLVQGVQPVGDQSWLKMDDRVSNLMETQAKNILTIQLTWVQQGLNAIGPCAQHWSRFLDGCTRQLQQMAESNGEINNRLVESYIELGKHLNVMATWNVTLQRSLKSWEDVLQKAAEIQPFMPATEPTQESARATSGAREKSAAGGKAS